MQEDMFELGEENPLQVNMKNVFERSNENKKNVDGKMIFF